MAAWVVVAWVVKAAASLVGGLVEAVGTRAAVAAVAALMVAAAVGVVTVAEWVAAAALVELVAARSEAEREIRPRAAARW